MTPAIYFYWTILMPLWYFIYSHRAALASPVTSSPRGLTSSTTRGATTATTTWRGASCPRTSKPGNRKKKQKTKKTPHLKHCDWTRPTSLLSLITLLSCFPQSGCRRLRVGEPEQRHQRLHRRGRRLLPPSSFRGAQPLLTRLIPADLRHFFFFLSVYVCTVSD